MAYRCCVSAWSSVWARRRFACGRGSYRGHPELHKRLILNATVALLGAAVGRVLPVSFAYLVVWLSPLFSLPREMGRVLLAPFV